MEDGVPCLRFLPKFCTNTADMGGKFRPKSPFCLTWCPHRSDLLKRSTPQHSSVNTGKFFSHLVYSFLSLFNPRILIFKNSSLLRLYSTSDVALFAKTRGKGQIAGRGTMCRQNASICQLRFAKIKLKLPTLFKAGSPSIVASLITLQHLQTFLRFQISVLEEIVLKNPINFIQPMYAELLFIS